MTHRFFFTGSRGSAAGRRTALLLLAACAGARLSAAAAPKETFGITTLTPPHLELHPHPGYWPRHRLWQGIPSIERAPGGRLWATWYAGPLQEGRGQNYQLLVTSADDGRTWSKPVAVFDPSRQLLGGDGSDAHLWLDPKGKLWWFVHRVMPSPGLHPRTCWGFYTDEPDRARPRWQGPVFAGHGNSLNKETVLADGTWLHMSDPLMRYGLPVPPEGAASTEIATGAHLYRFAGYSRPWEHVGHATISSKHSPGVGNEHMVVQRRDGSLWMLVRIPGGIAQAVSEDQGKTWRELEPFTQSFSNATRFFFRRLASGHLLLVVNDHPKNRANMTVILSEDEGRTWPFKLVIDERGAVSYPDGTEAPDGSIYVTYDRGRYNFDEQEILFAKITEADIRAGKLVSPQSRLKQVINKLSDEGGGVRFTGESAEMLKAFQQLSAEGGTTGSTTTAAPIASLPVTRQDIVVFKEPGLYGGWPANHGMWQWGDELVVGFTVATFMHQENAHAVDRSRPFEEQQARSLDGGLTWKIEQQLPFTVPAKAPKPVRLTTPLDFTAPDFALMFRFASVHAGPSWFYTSTDRCKTWRGPYAFAVEGIDQISTRTDLIVLGTRDCLMFGSAAKSNGKEGRVFCARTTDGGLTWKLVSYIGPEPAGFAIMPSSLRLKDGALLTTIRRSDPGVSGFIEAWRSMDQGAHWNYTGKAALDIGGSPPSLVQLPDGRVALTYGYRAKPHGVRARFSPDGGYKWGSEIILRDDGLSGDMGYPRSVVRPDGRVLTAYYFNGPRDDDRTIEATLWTPPDAAAEASRHRPAISPLTNGTEWKGDRPVALKNPQRPKVETAFIYQPETKWTYSHHPSITFFKGRFHAIWSNGRDSEDEPGQRVLTSSSADFRTWTPARPLVASVVDANGIERVRTAAGFHQYNGTLVAYFSNYGPNKETTHLQAVTTTDGEQWSAVREIGIPICPNHGPQRTSSGRLIIAGHTAFPYTDDPSGLTGWRMTGIYPAEMGPHFEDDPMTFKEVAMREDWPSALCEGSFFETDDGVLHMQLRNVSRIFAGRMWTTESRDRGVTWSKPALTTFSDSNTKFHFGRLPDGRFYCVGNPIAGNRTPLVLVLSRDGVKFDRHFILGDTPYQMRKPGGAKAGQYGYPHTLVHDGYLYTIVSRQKEAVQVLRVALSELHE